LSAAVGKAKIESLGGGRFRVAGVLDATTVTELLKHSPARFSGLQSVEIDLAGVSESDSSGLALLIEWLRVGRRTGQQVRFVNLPAQIAALARISEVDELFAANGQAQQPGV
jgi:phospholipid transport system transporter-binding protein